MLELIYTRLLEPTAERRRADTEPAAFYGRYLDAINAPAPAKPEGAASRNGKVHVYHHGLERVSVKGLEPGAAAQAETSLRQFSSIIRSPGNHRGAGWYPG